MSLSIFLDCLIIVLNLTLPTAKTGGFSVR